MDTPEVQEKKLQKLARFLGRKMKQLEKIQNQLKNNDDDGNDRNERDIQSVGGGE